MGAVISRVARNLAERLGRRLAHERGPTRTPLLDYPIHPVPRWGHGKPPHPALYRLIDGRRAAYREILERVLGYRSDLLRIDRDGDAGGAEPVWRNVWLPGLDAATLYTILRWRTPRRYVEVGSGVSTAFARRAIRDQGSRTMITSIDPKPRRAIDALCDEVVREPLETIDLSRFEELDAGDVLFVDGSHYAFMNSDATIFFLEVLPRLRRGVWVQVHDVFLPYDYPPAWNDSFQFYSEQYLLAASLLANPDRFEIVLANAFVSEDPELSSVLEPLWSEPGLAGVPRTGGSFWFAC